MTRIGKIHSESQNSDFPKPKVSKTWAGGKQKEQIGWYARSARASIKIKFGLGHALTGFRGVNAIRRLTRRRKFGPGGTNA